MRQSENRFVEPLLQRIVPKLRVKISPGARDGGGGSPKNRVRERDKDGLAPGQKDANTEQKIERAGDVQKCNGLLFIQIQNFHSHFDVVAGAGVKSGGVEAVTNEGERDGNF